MFAPSTMTSEPPVAVKPKRVKKLKVWGVFIFLTIVSCYLPGRHLSLVVTWTSLAGNPKKWKGVCVCAFRDFGSSMQVALPIHQLWTEARNSDGT